MGLRQNLSNLHQKIELIDSRSDLKNSFESLKNVPQTRASDLALEVKQLREDIKSIRKLLGLNLDKHNSRKS